MVKNPVISSLKGHNIESSYDDNTENVIKVSTKDSLHAGAIQEVLQIALEQLGGSSNLVCIHLNCL